MKNILMFESEEDLLDNYDKIIPKNSYSTKKPDNFIATIDIEPVVIRNVVCNELKFYREPMLLCDDCGQCKEETNIVLYAWGTMPFAYEDVWRFTSDHPLYKKFEYLMQGVTGITKEDADRIVEFVRIK